MNFIEKNSKTGKKKLCKMHMVFCYNMRKYRNIQGINIHDMYNRLIEYGIKISYSHLTQIERGSAAPSFEKVEAIAKILDIKVYFLFIEPTEKDWNKRFLEEPDWDAAFASEEC